jgi:cell division septal protein FtsQ
VSYYQGFRNPAPARAARSTEGGFARRRQEKSQGFSLKLFTPKEAPPAKEQKTYAFYRPGVTPVEDTPGFSSKKKAWTPRASAWGALNWALRLGGVALLVMAVAWSRQRTTALLQDVAGLRLSKVSVEGNHYLTEDEIQKAVALPLGENMFKLDLTAATERIKKMEWVDRVFIERRLPSSLLVSVRERKPVALLDNGTLYGVDREGRVLSPSAALLSEDLPLISGVALTADAVGTTRLAEALRPALDLFAFLGKHDPVMAADVSEVNLSETGALKVTFIDGIQAAFDPPVTETELRRMALVLSDLNQKEKRAGTMDFRFRDMVLVKTR